MGVLLVFWCALAAGERIDTLRISAAYTTHIIFATDLTYADLSNNRYVAAKIIEQNKNMLALKARERFGDSCSVSALESNGTMRTFIVVFDEHPKELVVDLRKRGEGTRLPASVPEAASVSPPNAAQAPAIENTIAAERTAETTFLLILISSASGTHRPA